MINRYRVWGRIEKRFCMPEFNGFLIDQQGKLFKSQSPADDNYVVQYSTSFTDRKGKEIYEGDILFCEESMFFPETTGVVVKDDDQYMYEIKKPDFCVGTRWTIKNLRAEIVGNIFESLESINRSLVPKRAIG